MIHQDPVGRAPAAAERFRAAVLGEYGPRVPNESAMFGPCTTGILSTYLMRAATALVARHRFETTHTRGSYFF